MQSYRSASDLDAACVMLCGLEPRFAPVIARHGTPSLRVGQATLEGLLMIVTEQFLSLAAAQAIWARVVSGLGTVTAQAIVAMGDDDLKALGLSTAKVRTFKAVARADLDFHGLAASDSTAVHRALCALPGIGPWTADIFLLSNLLRCDAWPSGDLALQVSAQNLLALPNRPTVRDMADLAESWRPHRAAAARILWSHYRDLKGLRQAS